MILEENFSEIMKATEIIRLIAYFNEQKELFENKNIKNKNLTKENKRFNLLEDQKALSDLKANFKDFENLNAHYVLTQYHKNLKKIAFSFNLCYNYMKNKNINA